MLERRPIRRSPRKERLDRVMAEIEQRVQDSEIPFSHF